MPIRKPKKYLEIPPVETKLFREWILEFWKIIGKIRSEHKLSSKYGWNPCQKAQRNYIAWCYKHKLSPKDKNNFVVYFNLKKLITESRLPLEMSLADWELLAADGTDPRGLGWHTLPIIKLGLGEAGNTSHQESGPPQDSHQESEPPPKIVEDSWEVVVTIKDKHESKENALLLKQTLRVSAKTIYGTSHTMWQCDYSRHDWGARAEIVVYFRQFSLDHLYETLLRLEKVPHRPESLAGHLQPKTYRSRKEIDSNRDWY